MKKTLLAVAISALSANAFAAVDLNATNPTVPAFATEIAVNATTGTALTNAGSIMDAAVKTGFSVAAGTSRFVRFDLSNGAKFGDVPALTGTTASFAATLSSGGENETFVIFEITGGTAQLPATEAMTLATATIDAFNDSNIGITYRLYETAAGAVNTDTSALLANASANLATFEAALNVTSTTPAAATLQIDVGSESKKFVGDVVTTDLARVTLNVDGTTLWTDGLAAAMTDVVAAGTKLVVSADITAGKKTGGNLTADVLALSTYGNTDARTNASADFNVGTAAVANETLAYIVDGETAIADGAFTALYDVTAAAGSDAADVNLGTISTLTKNGASVDLDFALTPGGAFSNYVRITNKTNLAGRVFITAYTDQGKSVTIDLGDVSGQTTTLGSQASTSLITIADIYAAVQAKDATFVVGAPANKLRLKIEGEFATIAAQSLTVSTDGTTFSTF